MSGSPPGSVWKKGLQQQGQKWPVLQGTHQVHGETQAAAGGGVRSEVTAGQITPDLTDRTCPWSPRWGLWIFPWEATEDFNPGMSSVVGLQGRREAGGWRSTVSSGWESAMSARAASSSDGKKEGRELMNEGRILLAVQAHPQSCSTRHFCRRYSQLVAQTWNHIPKLCSMEPDPVTLH